MATPGKGSQERDKRVSRRTRGRRRTRKKETHLSRVLQHKDFIGTMGVVNALIT
jgi:hypothetical protein